MIPVEKGGYLFQLGFLYLEVSTSRPGRELFVDNIPHFFLFPILFLQVIHRHFYQLRKNGNSSKSPVYAILGAESEVAK